MDLRAVLFDVDFTLAKPGPDLGPDGYRRLGREYGLDLDPARYPEARAAAIEAMERHPELRHDEELWFAFTERIVVGMGGEPPASRDLAVEMTRLWERSENFDLYDDVRPVLAELRGARAEARPRLERRPRDLGLRRPPRARGRLRDRLARRTAG